jgi:hypothetical protein
MGKPWCELRVSPELLRLMIKEAGNNPASPCDRGTYEDVARIAGLRGHQLVGHLAAGRRKTCSPTSALGIAGALGVPLEVLFMRRSSPLAVRNVPSERISA